MNKSANNNQVTIAGEVVGKFIFNHEVYGEGFYTTDIRVRRESGIDDVIPVMVSERLMDVTQDYTGQYMAILGQFRSFDCNKGKKRKLQLHVFAIESEIVEEMFVMTNAIYLDGYICKEPTYRITPLGKEIADIILAVNRPYSKSDYIPCIVWGRNARYMEKLQAGQNLKIEGRIQSREYRKVLEDGTAEVRVAYEVSINRFEVVTDES